MATLARLGVALFILLTWVDMTSAQTEQRVALVIGNGTYLNVRELKNPANDAKAMAAMLRRAGFDVIERENTTRRAMIEATRTFAEKLSPGGVGLFFYAGHGIQARGSNYLLPVDAALSREDDLKYEAVDVQDVLNKLDDARVRLSLVILDACRDNPFARSFRSTTRGLAQIDAPRGTLIAYATAPGKLAADGEGDNGVYTSELLKAMSEPGRTLQDVFGRVTDAVERRTANAQTPWISSSFRGDFYFIGPTTVTPVPPATSATPSQDAELLFWQTIVNSNDPADFRAYLDQYPQGRFALLARPRAAVRPQMPTGPQAGESGPERTPPSVPVDTTRPHSDAAVRPQPPTAPQAVESGPGRTPSSVPVDTTRPHSNEDWCVNKSGAFSPDQQISGCTALSTSGKNLAVAYYNRGLAYREKGDLDRAIADSNEAIRLDPKFSTYLIRGMHHLAAGDLPKALADFIQSSKLAPKNAYAALWAEIASRRSGLPGRLVEASRQIDMTKWPAPIIRLYLGQLTPEAVLTAADNPDVKTKRGQVCEANFYGGALALQRGERKEAARLYGLAVSSCPEDFIERREANAELKALSADH